MPPIYEHKCLDCFNVQEETYKMSEDPEIPCKVCGERTKRMMSTPSFKLAGHGWFKDAYDKPKKK